jgi:hypothetical protein
MTARTYAQIRKQISYDPCSREKRATKAQLDYIAQLIIDCEGKPGFRWDYNEPMSITVSGASNLINSLTRTKAGQPR